MWIICLWFPSNSSYCSTSVYLLSICLQLYQQKQFRPPRCFWLKVDLSYICSLNCMSDCSVVVIDHKKLKCFKWWLFQWPVFCTFWQAKMTKSGDVSSWQGCVCWRWRYRQHSDSVVIWEVGMEAESFPVFPLLSSLGKLCGCNNNRNIEGWKKSKHSQK